MVIVYSSYSIESKSKRTYSWNKAQRVCCTALYKSWFLFCSLINRYLNTIVLSLMNEIEVWDLRFKCSFIKCLLKKQCIVKN